MRVSEVLWQVECCPSHRHATLLKDNMWWEFVEWMGMIGTNLKYGEQQNTAVWPSHWQKMRAVSAKNVVPAELSIHWSNLHFVKNFFAMCTNNSKIYWVCNLRKSMHWSHHCVDFFDWGILSELSPTGQFCRRVRGKRKFSRNQIR